MSRTNSRGENLMLVAISVFLGLLLWVQVSEEQQVQKVKEFTLAIKYSNLRPGLVLVDQTEFVRIVVSGPARQVDVIDSEDIQPEVDLKNTGRGQLSLPIRLPPLDSELTASLSRSEASLRLEEVRSVVKTVEVEELGQTADDLRYDGSTVQPGQVKLSGPASQIARVKKVRVMLDLGSLRPGVAVQLAVEALDGDNQPLPLAISDPARVEVFPALAAASTIASVLVVPDFEGQPMFGFSVASYELTPASVRISGSSAAIANLQTLATEPIPIDQARSDLQGTIKLKVPDGVTVTPSDEVTYKIRIVPTPLRPNR